MSFKTAINQLMSGQLTHEDLAGQILGEPSEYLKTLKLSQLLEALGNHPENIALRQVVNTSAVEDLIQAAWFQNRLSTDARQVYDVLHRQNRVRFLAELQSAPDEAAAWQMTLNGGFSFASEHAASRAFRLVDGDGKVQSYLDDSHGGAWWGNGQETQIQSITDALGNWTSDMEGVRAQVGDTVADAWLTKVLGLIQDIVTRQSGGQTSLAGITWVQDDDGNLLGLGVIRNTGENTGSLELIHRPQQTHADAFDVTSQWKGVDDALVGGAARALADDTLSGVEGLSLAGADGVDTAALLRLGLVPQGTDTALVDGVTPKKQMTLWNIARSRRALSRAKYLLSVTDQALSLVDKSGGVDTFIRLRQSRFVLSSLVEYLSKNVPQTADKVKPVEDWVAGAQRELESAFNLASDTAFGNNGDAAKALLSEVTTQGATDPEYVQDARILETMSQTLAEVAVTPDPVLDAAGVLSMVVNSLALDEDTKLDAILEVFDQVDAGQLSGAHWVNILDKVAKQGNDVAALLADSAVAESVGKLGRRLALAGQTDAEASLRGLSGDYRVAWIRAASGLVDLTTEWVGPTWKPGDAIGEYFSVETDSTSQYAVYTRIKDGGPALPDTFAIATAKTLDSLTAEEIPILGYGIVGKQPSNRVIRTENLVVQEITATRSSATWIADNLSTQMLAVLDLFDSGEDTGLNELIGALESLESDNPDLFAYLFGSDHYRKPRLAIDRLYSSLARGVESGNTELAPYLARLEPLMNFTDLSTPMTSRFLLEDFFNRWVSGDFQGAETRLNQIESQGQISAQALEPLMEMVADNSLRTGSPLVRISRVFHALYWSDIFQNVHGGGSSATLGDFTKEVMAIQKEAIPALVTDPQEALAFSVSTDFTQGNRPDHAGFEEEFGRVLFTGVPITTKYVMGETQASELGVPVMQLELEQVTSPIFELITGPLNSSEYMTPEYYVAKRIFFNLTTHMPHGTSVKDFIHTYNDQLTDALGSADTRYMLMQPNPDVNEQIFLQDNRESEHYRYACNPQASILMPYDRIGSQAFIDSLSMPQTQLSATATAEVVDEIARQISPDVPLSDAARAMIFQTVFYELYLGTMRANNTFPKFKYEALFRFAPEDAIFGVLEENELNAIHDWYAKDNGLAKMKGLMLEKLPKSSGALFSPEIQRMGALSEVEAHSVKSLSFDGRMTRIFDTAIQTRLDFGRSVQLGVAKSLYGMDFAILPDGKGTKVYFSHPYPAARRPMTLVDGKAYGVVEYRVRGNPVVQLNLSPLRWMEGAGAETMASLVDNMAEFTPYELEAARVMDGVDKVTAYLRDPSKSHGEGEVTHYLTLIRALFSDAPVQPGATDPNRVRGWQSALAWNMKEFNTELANLGFSTLPEKALLDQRFNEGFGIDTTLAPTGGLEDPESVLSKTVDNLLAEFTDGSLTPEELQLRSREISRTEVNELYSKLIIEQLSDSPDPAVTRAVELMEDEIAQAYAAGLLSRDAQAALDLHLVQMMLGDNEYYRIFQGAETARLNLDATRMALFTGASNPGTVWRATMEDGRQTNTILENGLDASHYSLYLSPWDATRTQGADAPDKITLTDVTSLTNLLTNWYTAAAALPDAERQVYTQALDIFWRGHALSDGGSALTTYATVLRDPDTQAVAAVALVSHDLGGGQARIHAVLTDPAAHGATPQGAWWVGADRQALLSVSQLLLQQHQTQSLRFDTPFHDQETAARELFFTTQGAGSILESQSGETATEVAAAQWLSAQRLKSVSTMLNDLLPLVGNGENGLDTPTRDAITLFQSDLTQLESDLVSDDPVKVAIARDALGEMDERMADLAQRIRGVDEAAYTAVAGPALEGLRNTLARTDESIVSAFYTLLDTLPEGVTDVTAIRKAGPSAASLLWEMESLIRNQTPADFAQSIFPLMDELGETGAFSVAAQTLVKQLDFFDNYFPDHVAAVRKNHAWLDTMLFAPDDAYRAHTAYDTQWIVQLEDDPSVQRAAIDLAGKHPDISRIIRWNGSTFVDAGGVEVELGANSRLTLVGHGSPGELAGKGPGTWVELMMRDGILAHGQSLARISFVGCNLEAGNGSAHTYLSQGFGKSFFDALDSAGVTADSLSIRSSYMRVDRFGRKWTGTLNPDGSIRWSHRDGARKLVLTQGDDGVVTALESVAQGEVTVITGDASDALGQDKVKVVRFFNGRQVDEMDNPLEAGDPALLTPEQATRIMEEYGVFFSGTLIQDGDSFTDTPPLQPWSSGNIWTPPDSGLETGTDSPGGDTGDGSGWNTLDGAALENDALSPEDARTRISDLSMDERAGALSDLLERFGSSPGNLPLADVLSTFEDEVVRFYGEGELSREASAVVQVQLERVRLANQGMTSVYDEIQDLDNEEPLNLDPVRGGLFMSTQLHGSAVRYVVTEGEDKPVVTTLSDQSYTYETYRLDGPGVSSVTDFTDNLSESTPTLSNELRTTITNQLTNWIDNMPEEGEEHLVVYESFLDELNAGGVKAFGEEIQPTWVTVTRGPDNSIISLGMTSYNEYGERFTLEYVVTNSALLTSEKAAGEYWVGGGKETFIAMIQDALTRNPDAYVASIPANPKTEIYLRDFYFGRNSAPSLFTGDADWVDEDDDEGVVRTPRELADYDAAVKSLVDRELVVMRQRNTDLNTVVDDHVELAWMGQPLAVLGNGLDAVEAVSTSTHLPTLNLALRQLGALELHLGVMGQKARITLGDADFDLGAAEFVGRYASPVSDNQARIHLESLEMIPSNFAGKTAFQVRPGTMTDVAEVLSLAAELQETAPITAGLAAIFQQLADLDDAVVARTFTRSAYMALEKSPGLVTAFNQLSAEQRLPITQVLSPEDLAVWMDVVPVSGPIDLSQLPDVQPPAGPDAGVGSVPGTENSALEVVLRLGLGTANSEQFFDALDRASSDEAGEAMSLLLTAWRENPESDAIRTVLNDDRMGGVLEKMVNEGRLSHDGAQVWQILREGQALALAQDLTPTEFAQARFRLPTGTFLDAEPLGGSKAAYLDASGNPDTDVAGLAASAQNPTDWTPSDLASLKSGLAGWKASAEALRPQLGDAVVDAYLEQVTALEAGLDHVSIFANMSRVAVIVDNEGAHVGMAVLIPDTGFDKVHVLGRLQDRTGDTLGTARWSGVEETLSRTLLEPWLSNGDVPRISVPFPDAGLMQSLLNLGLVTTDADLVVETPPAGSDLENEAARSVLQFIEGQAGSLTDLLDSLEGSYKSQLSTNDQTALGDIRDLLEDRLDWVQGERRLDSSLDVVGELDQAATRIQSIVANLRLGLPESERTGVDPLLARAGDLTLPSALWDREARTASAIVDIAAAHGVELGHELSVADTLEMLAVDTSEGKYKAIGDVQSALADGSLDSQVVLSALKGLQADKGNAPVHVLLSSSEGNQTITQWAQRLHGLGDSENLTALESVLPDLLYAVIQLPGSTGGAPLTPGQISPEWVPGDGINGYEVSVHDSGQ